MKKFLILSLLILSLCLSLAACGKTPQPSGEKKPGGTDEDGRLEYEIEVSGKTIWEGAKAQFYDLKGQLAASADIFAGEAKVSLPGDTYIVQLLGAPETVSYHLPLLTKSEREGKIQLSDSTLSIEHYNYSILGVVLEDGIPKADLSVMICNEPEDGGVGFCLIPETTDKNGAVEFETYSGRYHVEVTLPKEFDPIFDEYKLISPAQRFFISDMKKELAPGGESNPGGGTGSGGESNPSGGTGSGGESNPSGGTNSGEHTHSYSWKTTKSATCTEAGERVGECSCGATKTEAIPPEHNWREMGDYRIATCTQEGYSARAVCSECGIERENTVTPPLGHDYSGSEFVYQEATCQRAGYSHVYCCHRNCNSYISRTLPIRDHDFAWRRDVVAPTCTTPGIIKYVCRFSCGTSTPEENVPANGHDWQEIKIITYPTCQAKGKATHVCLTCKENTEYELDKVEHRYGDYTVDTIATSQAEGKMSRHCIYCGAGGKDEKTIPKIDNKFEYEIKLIRDNGMPYSPENDSGFKNLKYEIYKESTLIQTVTASSCTVKASISKDATKLKVLGLKEGFTAVQEEISLDPGSPIVSVYVRGALQKGTITEKNGKMVAENVQDLTVGDAMYDFYIYDTVTKEGKPLSEMMQGKKLVFLDFFHTQCGFCTHYMKMFTNVYNRVLHKYKDDILVLMLDNMDYESDETINIYRNNERYLPEEFISSSCSYGGMNVRTWFTTKTHRVANPGHVWLDSEGVIYFMDVKTEEEDFVELVEGYFDRLNAFEQEYKKVTETKTSTIMTEADKPYVFDRRKH